MNQNPKGLRSLIALLVSQTQVVFNDNSAKFMLMALAPFVLSAEESGRLTSLIPALLVLPFILLAPVVGWLSDRYSKSRVLNYDLLFQFVVMLWVVGCVAGHHLTGAVFGFFLLAVQACIFSPAKQGILKEMVGPARLGMAVGWMEMLTISAILGGTYFGGKYFDQWTQISGDPWKGALWMTGFLSAGSLLSWIIFQGVEKTEAQSRDPFRVSLLWEHFIQLRDLWRLKPLRLAALGSAYFYSFGGALYLAFVQLGRELHGGKLGSATESGAMLVILGGGIIAGSLLAAFFCRRQIELGIVPVGGLGISLSMLVLGISNTKSPSFYAGLIALGTFGGLFTVPLNAFLQDRAMDEQRGRVLAAANLMSNIGGIGAVGVYFVLGSVLKLTAPQQFLVFLFPTALVALYVIWLLPESLLRLGLLVVARCIYRVRSEGLEHLPKGGALLICNHVSYVDAFVLQAACPRPIRFIAFDAFHRNFWFGWALKILGVIPISSQKAKGAVQQAAERLKEGELVCIFPEGAITRTGTLQGIRKGFEWIAKQAERPVVPVSIDRMWGSIFSFSGQRYIWKKPVSLPYSVFVKFGESMDHEKVSQAAARQALLDEGEEAFRNRPELKKHIGWIVFRSLAAKPWRLMMVDMVPQRREFSRGLVLALSIALSWKWRKLIPQKRVGIVLPPGIGATLANIALMLMGKTPVNLNFTAGRAVMESCLRRAEIGTIITAAPLKAKFTDFPWPDHILDISEEIDSLGKARIFGWLSVIHILPAAVLGRLLGVPEKGDHEEATILFTSGSYGEPKGVVLSHRNVLANVIQLEAIGAMYHEDVLLACLPLFHSFGHTVTLWGAIILGLKYVTIPSPLETRKITEAIRTEKATVFMGTPTFYRPFLRKARDTDLKTLRLVVAGAEKLPTDLAQAFQAKFGVKIFEGYGLTETSAVVSVNLPDPPKTTRLAGPQMGSRAGSVGRMIPGMTARIVDPDTGAERTLDETGLLWLKGSNVFEGYLHDEERTRQALKDGWLITGDLARFDEEGFLFIEGRLSRFSKIGGEMVPHGRVEQRIIELFGFEGAEAQPLMVTGIPDEAKGESLVILSTVDLDMAGVREKLTADGMPNLWIPKAIKRLEKIPVLGTGKLDLKACEKLAREGTEKNQSAEKMLT